MAPSTTNMAPSPIEMKMLKGILLACLMITGCNTIYINPEPTPTRTPPLMETQYEFVSYDFLYWVITGELGVPDQGDATDPRENPGGFLYDHRYALGAPSYNGNDSDDVNTGGMTSLGIKTWIQVANGACGLKGEGDGWKYFYPANYIDPENIDPMYIRWLSRYPIDEERIVFEDLYIGLEEAWVRIKEDQTDPRWEEVAIETSSVTGKNRRKTIAACTTILTTMEFLTEN